MDDLDVFICGMPKAELHVHIEGTLEPEMMLAFARRNGVAIPYTDEASVRADFDYGNLQDFIDVIIVAIKVLVTEQDFHELTVAYLERAAADGIVHAEIMFEPQAHVARGVAFDTVMRGLLSATEEAGSRLGITTRLIMNFARHLPEEEAYATLRTAEPWLDRIDAVGLASSEEGNPPSKFVGVFAEARRSGLRCVAHAGEEGPAGYVTEALDLLEVERIDHGNASLDDPALTVRLARSGMALTLCPLSNLKLHVIENMADHPTHRMLRAGIRATVNSDDPAFFGGYAAANYRAVVDAFGLDRDALVTLARNSFLGSFLSDEEVAAKCATLDDWAVGQTR